MVMIQETGDLKVVGTSPEWFYVWRTGSPTLVPS